MTIAVMAVAAAGTLSPRPSLHAAVGVLTRFVGPTSSQPLALTANGAFLVAANPDNDSVTFFDVRADRNRRAVHRARAGRALGRRLPARRQQGLRREHRQRDRLDPARQPRQRRSCAGHTSTCRSARSPTASLSRPTARKLYVTNARSDTVSVIDTATDSGHRHDPGRARAARPRHHQRRRRGRHTTRRLRDPVPVVRSRRQDRRRRRRQGGPRDADLHRDGHGHRPTWP